RRSQLTDEQSQRPYEKDQDENHQPDGDVLERGQRLPMEHNAVRNLPGHNRSQRETHEPERPQRIADKHKPARAPLQGTYRGSHPPRPQSLPARNSRARTPAANRRRTSTRRRGPDGPRSG